jgi:hypothetical protein
MREIVQTPAGTRFVDEMPEQPDIINTFEAMVRVAERDLSGDALKARIEEIYQQARSAGFEIPEGIEPDSRGRELYDAYHASGRLSATAGSDGYPSVLPAAQVSFWADVTKDAQPDPSIPGDLLADVKTWLSAAAGGEQAKTLIDMAERSAPIARALAAYAAAGKRFVDGRPK